MPCSPGEAGTGQGEAMLEAVAAGAGPPAVAALLGLGAAGLAGAVVAMAWNVHVRQIRLAEQLARRQFIVTADAGAARPAANGNGAPEAALVEAGGVAGSGGGPGGVRHRPGNGVTREAGPFCGWPSGKKQNVCGAGVGWSGADAPPPGAGGAGGARRARGWGVGGAGGRGPPGGGVAGERRGVVLGGGALASGQPTARGGRCG